MMKEAIAEFVFRENTFSRNRVSLCSRSDVFQNAGLEIAAGDALEIEEHVIAMLGQVLEDRQCPGCIGAAIADENGLLDASHYSDLRGIFIAYHSPRTKGSE